jgi:PTH2 family peptidyl-tRNA hydrolase
VALNLNEFGYKQVIAVRTDLEMGRGKIAVQVAHAAVSAFENVRKKHHEWANAWLAEGQCKIAVKVKSEKDLVTLEETALELGISAVVIRDRGLTQLPPDTATCIGIGPGPTELVDRITRDLKLL